MTDRTLSWHFRAAHPDGAVEGGDATKHAFDPSLDTLAREIIQNSKDQDLNQGPVKIKFEFIEIAGAERNKFEKFLDWEYLHTHLMGVAETSYTDAARIQRELGELDQRPGLRILRITDFGTKGLIGPETSAEAMGADEGNFAPLLRNTLTNQRSDGGGSFGLGKSILWRYSGIATVLFFSELSEFEGQPSKSRLFGRAHYGYHLTPGTDADNRWAGPGWFGQSDETLGRASVWDASPETISALQLDRSPGSGTTALILDFDEPDTEEDRPLVDAADDLYKAIERNYWPALLQGILEVEITVKEHGNDEYRRTIDSSWAPTDEIKPFVDAWNKERKDCVKKFSGDVDEVVEASITVNVPERKADNPASKADVEATLRLISFPATESSKAISNRIALIRGAGMVVEYKSFPIPQDLDYAVCGFFSGGLTARGLGQGGHDRTALSETDKEHEERLEFFLRACEPPAHHKWDNKEERCKKYFPDGAWGALDKLLGSSGSIKEAIANAVFTEPPPGGVIPEGLGRLLRFGTGGTVNDSGKLNVTGKASFADGQWKITGRVSNTRPVGNWTGRLSTGIHIDGSSKGMNIPISSAQIDGKEVMPQSGSVIFSTSNTSAKFEVLTDPKSEYTSILDLAQIWANALLVESDNNE